MTGPRVIDDAERRARLGRCHALAAPAPDVVAATEAVVALHSSDPVAVPLAARARVAGLEAADVDRALYDDRALVRLHGVRRTLWVVPRDLVPAVLGAAARPLVAPQRGTLRKLLAAAGDVADPDGWIQDVADRTVAAVATRGEASATELAADVPELAHKVVYGPGTKWEAEVTVGSRLLVELGFAGLLVRARPLGSWVSSQYRYAPRSWIGDEGAALEAAAGRAEIVGRYVRAFGPVTTVDVRWWTGWTVAHVTAALAAAGAVEVATAAGPAHVAPDAAEPVAAAEPWVALLPGLDPTTMGWKERAWYLGDLGPTLFDRNGNAGPTVWCDGRIVGGWAQRPDGRVVTDVRVDVGAEALARIDAEAAALEAWLGGVVVTPRFRTPLERALATGGPVP